MDQFKLAEFAKSSENKEGAEFTQAVQEAGIAQGSLIVSKLYNTMLGEVTRVLKSWNTELTNVLTAAGLNPSALTNEQLVAAFIHLIKTNSNGLQIGDLVANVGTTSPTGRVLCNGQRLVNCRVIFPDFYNYVLASTPYVTVDKFNSEVQTYGQCGFCAVDGDDVIVPLITRPISGVSNLSQTGQAILDTMRPIKGVFTSFDRGDRGLYTGPYYVESRWSTGVRSGSDDFWGSRVATDTAKLGARYNGTETRGKQIQYPYYIQVYTAVSDQSLVNASALVEMLKYQNQLGLTLLPAQGGVISLTNGGIYRGILNQNTVFTLPSVTDISLFSQILIQLQIVGEITIDWGTNAYFSAEPTNAEGSYNIVYEYDPTVAKWVVGQIEKVLL